MPSMQSVYCFPDMPISRPFQPARSHLSTPLASPLGRWLPVAHSTLCGSSAVSNMLTVCPAFILCNAKPTG